MRHFVYALVLLMVTVCTMPVFASAADLTANKKDLRVDGQTWIVSTEEEKLAFLLGVEVMVATEKALAERIGEARKARADKRPYSGPSPFVKGWLKAFPDTDRRTIMANLDKYIETHPDARTQHVFEILWYEFIAPKIGSKWQKKESEAWTY